MKKVAIIGGGASGLLCAIYCARKNLSVDLFEQNQKLGKKILVSGNGRCNITNEHLSSDHYFSQDPKFTNYALDNFGFTAFSKFCKSIGLLLNIQDDGKVYPLSNEAKSVLTLLETQAKNLGVNIFVNSKVTDIKKILLKYDAVVIATGSEAASHLGGGSDGLEFARVFAHNIIPTYPSLVQLETDAKFLKKMAGVKIKGEVTLLINNQVEKITQGDILFTNYGLSGFAILDISQSVSIALSEYQSVQVSLNLLPNFNAQKLSAHILSASKEIQHITLHEILCGLVPQKIANGIIEHLNLEEHRSHIDTKLSKKIANALLNLRLNIDATHGFRHAEVSGGGVDVSEIDPKTMESYKQKNLYFCGEVLDVVGERGGYNFAWAWASAYLAAQSISITKIC